MASRLAMTAAVEDFCRGLKAGGCVVDRDKDAGTVVAKEDDIVVFRAIQKGRNQPWIVSFYDGNRVKWKWSD